MATDGNASGPRVTLRRAMVRGRRMWSIDWRDAAGRHRKFYRSQEAAEDAADEIRRLHGGAERAWSDMPAADRADVLRILAEMAQRGVSLRRVWEDHIDRGEPTAGSVVLGRAVSACVASKRASGRRERYVDDLEWLLEAFASGREETPIASLTSADVSEWVAARYSAPWSVSTARSRLSTLFAFAARQGWLAANPCDRLERITPSDEAPAILTVRQSARLLVFVRRRHPRGLAWFALALLAGIRPEECDRLTWDAVRLGESLPVVVVDAAASKVRRRRIVHLMPAAADWLQLAKDHGGELPLPHVTRRRILRAVRDRLGFAKWPQDVLRHTAASFLMAEWRDAGRVAAELGNSPNILLRHYRELVTRADAERFWRLVPKSR